VALGTGIAAALANGAWVTAGLAHLSRRQAWFGWIGFQFGATATITLLFGVLASRSAHECLQNLWDLASTGMVFAVVLAVSPIGIPLGRALMRARLDSRLRSLRRLRARRRLRYG
jgi:hypothetical protein